MARKLLTRAEMWTAICEKYPSLGCLRIESAYMNNSTYVNREQLFKMILDMKIHKSRHLKKVQKMKIIYELNKKIFDKL